MPYGPRVFSPSWAGGQILVHLENVVILLKKVSYQDGFSSETFILGPDVHWQLYFYSVASDTRVHARSLGQKKSSNLKKKQDTVEYKPRRVEKQ